MSPKPFSTSETSELPIMSWFASCILRLLPIRRSIEKVGSSKLNGIGLLCVIEIIGLYFIVRNRVFIDELSAALRVHLLIFNDRGH
jgi:hypothetical protein